MRQVPTREFPIKFSDWDLSHSFKFGIFVGILLLIFSCDIILTRQSLGRPRAPPEPVPFKVHSRRWGVIPILIRDKSNIYVLRQSAELECTFFKIVTNSKIKRILSSQQPPVWAKDKGRFVYHVHLSHHRSAKSWFQSLVTSEKYYAMHVRNNLWEKDNHMSEFIQIWALFVGNIYEVRS